MRALHPVHIEEQIQKIAKPVRPRELRRAPSSQNGENGETGASVNNKLKYDVSLFPCIYLCFQ